MDNQKPLILISNDDGYHAKGIRALVDMVKDMADIIVCAPDAARSGFSCAFTAAKPLTFKRRKDIESAAVWSCSGTPADCIKIGLDKLCVDRQPDLILSGINHGDNASINNHYSGTVGAVKEGCMKCIPSVAFSLCDERADADFEPLRPFVRKITERVLSEGLPQNVCLNVNFPLAERFNGVKVCRMANGLWVQEVESREHPFGFPYHWLAGHYHCLEPEAEDTDKWALTHGYVAITPTTIDVTAYDMMARVASWGI